MRSGNTYTIKAANNPPTDAASTVETDATTGIQLIARVVRISSIKNGATTRGNECKETMKCRHQLPPGLDLSTMIFGLVSVNPGKIRNLTPGDALQT